MEIQELLVESAILGDNNAFTKIYECIYKDMYRYAYYMLGNEQDAEDIVSDTVIDIYVGMNKLRDVKAFKSWTFKILSNKCKRKRKQYVQKTVSIDDENINIHLKDDEKDLAQRCDLEQALNILKYEERSIVLLSVFGGYKSDEIGAVLNIKPTTARSKLKRALEKMKKAMEADGNGK